MDRSAWCLEFLAAGRDFWELPLRDTQFRGSKQQKRSRPVITRLHATRSDPHYQRHPKYPDEPSVMDAGSPA